MAGSLLLRRRAAMCVLAGAFALGCRTLRSSSTDDDDTDVATIIVTNHHRLNVTVFNVAQGHRDRIAEVTAASAATIPVHLRRFAGRELQLFGDAVGSSETARAELVRLAPGDIVEWTLETDLNRSFLSIR